MQGSDDLENLHTHADLRYKTESEIAKRKREPSPCPVGAELDNLQISEADLPAKCRSEGIHWRCRDISVLKQKFRHAEQVKIHHNSSRLAGQETICRPCAGSASETSPCEFLWKRF